MSRSGQRLRQLLNDKEKLKALAKTFRVVAMLHGIALERLTIVVANKQKNEVWLHSVFTLICATLVVTC